MNHCGTTTRWWAEWHRSGKLTAELNRRVQVTATKSWPDSPRTEDEEVDNQVAAPAETGTPNLHRAIIAHKECGWKDGVRGGLA
jgi:hypothetical protein